MKGELWLTKESQHIGETQLGGVCYSCGCASKEIPFGWGIGLLSVGILMLAGQFAGKFMLALNEGTAKMDRNLHFQFSSFDSAWVFFL